MLSLDHLVFAARDLDTGAAWMSERLQVPPVGGGAHPMMGTHNRLWQLDGAYLEVIAIDPAAPAPPRARWFGLDDPALRARLETGPTLLTWMARSDDLEADLARAPLDPGPAVRLTRDALHWDFTVRDDGALHWQGVYPGLIRWPEGVTPPSDSLPDQGLSLTHLGAAGPAALLADLDRLGAAAVFDGLERAEKPALSARIRTAEGREVTFTSDRDG